MALIKVDDTVKRNLDKLKVLHGKKSYSAVLEDLVAEEVTNYCYTQDGLAKIGTLVQIDDSKYEIVDIGQEYVYARNGIEVIEFHKKGRIAWQARIVDE